MRTRGPPRPAASRDLDAWRYGRRSRRLWAWRGARSGGKPPHIQSNGLGHGVVRAPEQRCDAKRADRRAGTFALGRVLDELCGDPLAKRAAPPPHCRAGSHSSCTDAPNRTRTGDSSQSETSHKHSSLWLARRSATPRSRNPYQKQLRASLQRARQVLVEEQVPVSVRHLRGGRRCGESVTVLHFRRERQESNALLHEAGASRPTPDPRCLLCRGVGALVHPSSLHALRR